MGGVVEDATRKGEATCSIRTRRACEKYHDFDEDGWVRPGLSKIIYSNLKSSLRFLERICTSGFLTSTADRNRFLLVVVLTEPSVPDIYTGPNTTNGYKKRQ